MLDISTIGPTWTSKLRPENRIWRVRLIRLLSYSSAHSGRYTMSSYLIGAGRHGYRVVQNLIQEWSYVTAQYQCFHPCQPQLCADGADCSAGRRFFAVADGQNEQQFGLGW